MYVHRFLLDKYTLCISKVDTNVEIVYQKKGKEMTDSVAENFSVFFFAFFPRCSMECTSHVPRYKILSTAENFVERAERLWFQSAFLFRERAKRITRSRVPLLFLVLSIAINQQRRRKGLRK